MENLNTYLVAVAKSLVISDDEQSKIRTSISNLQTKLNNWYGDELYDHFRFGSSTRDTILPRKVDENSDIDYMVVFKNTQNYKPTTLLNRLKSFVETKYSRSEIYRSHPTIVLELSHIKFELVPAIKQYSWSDTHYIPAPSSDYSDWMETNPSGIQKKVNDANSRYHSQIKRLIRLLKYWNVMNGKVYSSYELEDHIAGSSFWLCTSLEDYFFDAVKDLPTWSLPQYKQNKVNALKAKVAEIKKYYYENDWKYLAAEDLEKLLPMP